MKLLYTSDLHGNAGFYRDLLLFAEKCNINGVIIGGDLLPRKGHGDNTLEYQRSFFKKIIQPFAIQLKEKTGSDLYLIFGNNDLAAVLPVFKEAEESGDLHLLHGQVFSINSEIFISGYPFIPQTHFSPKDFEKRDLKDDVPRKMTSVSIVTHNGKIETVDELSFLASRTSIEEDLAVFSKTDDMAKTIVVMHTPPFDTTLDRIHNDLPIGSKAVKHFILKNQPLMTLHGHIHESPEISGRWLQKIGTTLSINPGQIGEMLSAVVFDTDDPLKSLTHTVYGKFTGFDSR